MPNRHSAVNNCPNCHNRLWLRMVKKRRFYNCLHCGYEQEFTPPERIERRPAILVTEQLPLFEIDDADPSLAGRQ